MERGNDAAIPNNEIYAKARGKGYVKMRIIGVNRLATAILSEYLLSLISIERLRPNLILLKTRY